MTASGTATIIGISLTFGINSCRESHRVKREAEKSMMQAIENLDERFDDAQAWMDIINNQTRVFRITDSINRCGGEIPDSLCDEFRNTMPFIKISAFDHEFEKNISRKLSAVAAAQQQRQPGILYRRML